MFSQKCWLAMNCAASERMIWYEVYGRLTWLASAVSHIHTGPGPGQSEHWPLVMQPGPWPGWFRLAPGPAMDQPRDDRSWTGPAWSGPPPPLQLFPSLFSNNNALGWWGLHISYSWWRLITKCHWENAPQLMRSELICSDFNACYQQTVNLKFV